MIKQTLIAAALVATLVSPALAADPHHGGNHNDNHNNRVQSHQSYRGSGYNGRGQAFHPHGPPPQARYERQGSYRRGYAWRPGYYNWVNSQYVWIPGGYIAQPYPGARWQVGTWQIANGIWIQIGGRWY